MSETAVSVELSPAELGRLEGIECIKAIQAALAARPRRVFFSVRSMEFWLATVKRFDRFGDEKMLISPRELRWLRDLRKKCGA